MAIDDSFIICCIFFFFFSPPASCNPSLCSGHGECIETINNHTCHCNPGFYGPECEFGKITPSCFSTRAIFMLASVQFGLLIHLLSQWDWLCTFLCFFEVKSCDPLKKPDYGSLQCNHPLENFSYNSSCTVQCEEGYELTALESVYCTSSGNWSAPLAACKGELLKHDRWAFYIIHSSKIECCSFSRYKLKFCPIPL